MKISETGRSMVEMLGVLAIMGVLTVGAMLGYRYAMDRILTNSIITGVRARSVIIGQQRVLGQPLNLSEFHPDTEKDLIYGHFEVKAFNDYVYDGEKSQAMEVHNIPKRVCEKIQDTEFPDVHITLVNGDEVGDTPQPCIPDGPTENTGGIHDAGDYFTAEYHNTVTFVFMNLEDVECESNEQCAFCRSCIDGLCTPDEDGARCGGPSGGCCMGGQCLPPGKECTCIASYDDPTSKAYACCLQGYTEGTQGWTCCLNPNDLVCQPPADKCAGKTCGDCMRCDSDTGTCVLDATKNGQPCGSNGCSVCENETCQNKTTQITKCNGTKENCCPLTAACTDETGCVKECMTIEDCGFCEACTDGQCVSMGIEYITKCDGTQEACCTGGGMVTCESPTDCRCAEGETWDDSPEAKASGKGTSEGACCPAEWTWHNGECCRTSKNHWTGKQTKGCCISFGATWYKKSDGTWSCCGQGTDVVLCPKCWNVTCPDCGKCDEKTGYCVTDEDQIGTPCGTTGCSVCDHGGACVDQRVEITTCNGDTKQCCPLNGNTCTNETNCPIECTEIPGTCQKCNTTTGKLVPDKEGESCGTCGICSNGQCINDNNCSSKCTNNDVWDTSAEAKNYYLGDRLKSPVAGQCCPNGYWNGQECCTGSNNYWTQKETEGCCVSSGGILCPNGQCTTGCCDDALPKDPEAYHNCYKCNEETHKWYLPENMRWCPKSKTCTVDCCTYGSSNCCRDATHMDHCLGPTWKYTCEAHRLKSISKNTSNCLTSNDYSTYEFKNEWGKASCIAHKVTYQGRYDRTGSIGDLCENTFTYEPSATFSVVNGDGSQDVPAKPSGKPAKYYETIEL